MLITDNYREVNRTLHDNEHYGRAGAGWYKSVLALMKVTKSNDVLDYGCGKGNLAKTIKEKTNVVIKEYDPAIPEKETRPDPADIVICTDVLEHIERECLYDVFMDLKRVVNKIGFFTIATRAARKTLPDGRNAHLIIKKPDWWISKLLKHFDVRHIELDASTQGELVVLVNPKGEANETDPHLHRIRSS